jgi:mRNA (2'-O-methyladenosine-N6-)-methyltransferase
MDQHRLVDRQQELVSQIESVRQEIAALELKLYGPIDTPSNDMLDMPADLDLSEFDAPEWCIPIRANVIDFDWSALGNACQFDVILMDPPWQLATNAPTRGVAIGYQQLPDWAIQDMKIPLLSQNGFIFIWVINNKYVRAFELLNAWGYTFVDDLTWVKRTVNRRMAKGHGYYLQHAKETCLVGKKGDVPGCVFPTGSDVIYSERRGQSQKPEELYELIEQLVPNGKYLEIFGRKNNLRDYWVTIGNEL